MDTENMQKLMTNFHKTNDTCHKFQDPDRVYFHTANVTSLSVMATVR